MSFRLHLAVFETSAPCRVPSRRSRSALSPNGCQTPATKYADAGYRSLRLRRPVRRRLPLRSVTSCGEKRITSHIKSRAGTPQTAFFVLKRKMFPNGN